MTWINYKARVAKAAIQSENEMCSLYPEVPGGCPLDNAKEKHSPLSFDAIVFCDLLWWINSLIEATLETVIPQSCS